MSLRSFPYRSSVRKRTGSLPALAPQRANPAAPEASRAITLSGVLQSLAVLFLLVPLAIYVIRSSFRDVLIIDPFSVPKGYSEAGLTPEVMASRMRERLGEIESTTQTYLKKDMLSLSVEQASIPEVEIPGTKLGLPTVVDITRDLFHRYPKHIGGDVVLATDGVLPSSAPSFSKARGTVTVHFTQDRNNTQSLQGTAVGNRIDEIVQLAAELTLEQINPYLLAGFYYESREYDRAARILERLAGDPVKLPEQREPVLVLWGVVLAEERNFDEAHTRFVEAIQISPKDANAHYNCGHALQDLGRSDEAANEYKKTIDLDSTYENAYLNLGNLQYERKEYEQAAANYNKGRELAPSDPNPYVDLGNLFNVKGKNDQAVAILRKGLERVPASALLHNSLGSVLYQQGSYDAALAEFKQAIDADPDSADAYYGVGDVFSMKRQYKQAGAYYKKALALNPDLPWVLHNWGNALRGEGKIADARRKYAQAERLTRKDSAKAGPTTQALSAKL